jgi:polysaccharide deacetylase 2 family uncharacterized protein YibQ
LKTLRNILTILILTFALYYVFTLSNCKSKPAEQQQEEEQQQDKPKEHKEPATDTTETKTSSVDKYTYQWKESKDMPPVCIVIDDFGQIGGTLLEGFAKLDDNITFAILPDLPNTQKTAKMANIYGHEVILHIPMQALDTKQNPGKTYIHVGEDKADIKAAINGWLNQVPQAIGANNHMGSGVTSDYNTILATLEAMNKKGLFFLDSKTAPHSKVVNAASELGIEYAARDIFLDVPDVSAANLSAKLKELQKFKGRVEPVIIISHCHNQAKLDAMRSFVSQLQGMGIRLVPLSDAVKKFNLPA